MIIWITGASSGIGRALALHYAEQGHTVCVSARRLARLQALAEESRSMPGDILPFELDVTDAQAARSVLEHIERDVGPIARVVLNAGYYEPAGLEALSLTHFRDTFSVNLDGVLHCLMPCLDAFRESGSGQIAMVASVAGYRGLPRASAYGASKAALIHLAESLKPECRNVGIDVRVVCPGFVTSELTAKNRFAMPAIVSAETAALRIAKGLDTSRFEITFPWRFVVVMKLLRCLPYRLYFALTARLAKSQ